jgi:hypothetical protein
MNHFDMHEDITETRNHLASAHHAVPEVNLGALGQGAAEVLAAQHERLHKRQWFFTFGMGMILSRGRAVITNLDGVSGLPLGGRYVTILAHTEDEARERMLAVFGSFAAVYDEQRGLDVVKRHNLTPLLAGGDLE